MEGLRRNLILEELIYFRKAKCCRCLNQFSFVFCFFYTISLLLFYIYNSSSSSESSNTKLFCYYILFIFCCSSYYSSNVAIPVYLTYLYFSSADISYLSPIISYVSIYLLNKINLPNVEKSSSFSIENSKELMSLNISDIFIFSFFKKSSSSSSSI